MNSKVFELSKLLSELDGQGGYFIDFISTRGIQAGIIRLHPGENDSQEPHSVVEVYYGIEGNGFIKLDGKDHQISDGQCVFVPRSWLGRRVIAFIHSEYISKHPEEQEYEF